MWVVNMRAEWTKEYYNIENYVLEDYVIDKMKKFLALLLKQYSKNLTDGDMPTLKKACWNYQIKTLLSRLIIVYMPWGLVPRS